MLTDLNNNTLPRRMMWNVRLHQTEGNAITVHFPSEFTSSTREKYVKVHGVRLFINTLDDNGTIIGTSEPNYISFHASFNQDNMNSGNCDDYVCFCNATLVTPKIYQQYTTQQTFQIRLYDETSCEFLNFSDADDHLLIELELVY